MRKKDSTTLVVARLIAEGTSIDPRRNIYLGDKPTKRKQRIEGVSARFVASEALRETDLGKPNLVNLSIYGTLLRCSVDGEIRTVVSSTRLQRFVREGTRYLNQS